MSIEDEGLNGFEAALGSLVPSRSQIDRDRVMFVAGQTAAKRTIRVRRTWMAVAASFAFVALGEGALLLSRPSQIVERVVVVREPAVPVSLPVSLPLVAQTSDPAATMLVGSLGFGWSERGLQARQVFLYGLDGLSVPASNARPSSLTPPESSRKSLREELLKDLDLGDHS